MNPLWGLFAVLVGTFLPLSLTLRAAAQVFHDQHYGLWHPVNVYRWIKIALIVPVLALISPAGVYLMFGLGDADMAERIVTFLASARGVILVLGLLIAAFIVDKERPRMIDHLTRQPTSHEHRTRIQFRHDTMIVLIILGLALISAPFV
jgi:fumarate reductase subunit D